MVSHSLGQNLQARVSTGDTENFRVYTLRALAMFSQTAQPSSTFQYIRHTNIGEEWRPRKIAAAKLVQKHGGPDLGSFHDNL